MANRAGGPVGRGPAYGYRAAGSCVGFGVLLRMHRHAALLSQEALANRLAEAESFLRDSLALWEQLQMPLW